MRSRLASIAVAAALAAAGTASLASAQSPARRSDDFDMSVGTHDWWGNLLGHFLVAKEKTQLALVIAWYESPRARPALKELILRFRVTALRCDPEPLDIETAYPRACLARAMFASCRWIYTPDGWCPKQPAIQTKP